MLLSFSRSALALGVLLVGLWPRPAEAQPSLQGTVEQLRAEYPTPMSEAQRGELLNRVAWQHRHEGFGLHLKNTGAKCPQPGTATFISCDLIVHAPTQGVFDVLIDGEGAARPTWSLVGPINTMANFVSPTGPPSAPPSGPPGGPGPTPAPVDLQPVLSALDTLTGLLGEFQAHSRQEHAQLGQAVAALQAEALAHHIRLSELIEEGIVLPPAPVPPVVTPPADGSTAGQIGLFVVKYVAPAVGTALATWWATRNPPAAAATVP